MLGYLTIFAAGHAVRVSEKAGKGSTARYSGQLADEGNRLVGGFQQMRHMLQTVAGDEVHDRLAMRTLVDSLYHIRGVRVQKSSQRITVQVLVGVRLLFGHQRTQTAIE